MPVRNVTALSILEQSFVYTDQDTLAGILVTTECLLGFLMLLGVIIGCFRLPALKTPFGVLMINQNLAQLLACTNSGSFFALGVLLDLKPVTSTSYLFGNLSILLLPVILGSFLLMSLNRVCACTMPFYYQKIFGPQIIKVYIVLNWILPIIATVCIVVFKNCNFIFYHFGWLFTSAPWNEKCGSFLLYYATYVQLVLSVIVFAADLITLIVLLGCRSRVYHSHNAETRRREINFASQVLIQGVIFIMHGFWYDSGYAWIPGDSENWKIFFTTSFSSNLLHVFDPLIVFAFNNEFRRWVLGKKNKIAAQHKITMVSSNNH